MRQERERESAKFRTLILSHYVLHMPDIYVLFGNPVSISGQRRKGGRNERTRARKAVVAVAAAAAAAIVEDIVKGCGLFNRQTEREKGEKRETNEIQIEDALARIYSERCEELKIASDASVQ